MHENQTLGDIPTAALIPVAVLVVGWAGFCLYDIARRPSTRGLNRIGWALVAVVSIPLGGVLYMLVGRARDPGERPGGHKGGTRTGPQPPVPRSGEPARAHRTSLTRGAPTLSGVGLIKRYAGGVGLLGVDLRIGPTGVHGLVGPNGAGKTTLLSLVCALLPPDRGAIRRSGRLALCPDAPEFEPWLTGEEVLRQSFALAWPGDVLDGARVGEVARATGLEQHLGRRCGGYSRGMTQRLGIAAALVLDPDLLVLDEPTSALDAAGRVEVLELVRRLGEQRAVLLSSHTLADVQRVADTVIVLDHGRVRYAGQTDDLVGAHLRPTWRVRVSGDAGALARALELSPVVERAAARAPTELDVEFATVDTGEQRLVRLLADAGARVVSMAPVDADLESAYLTLTGSARRRSAAAGSAAGSGTGSETKGALR